MRLGQHFVWGFQPPSSLRNVGEKVLLHFLTLFFSFLFFFSIFQRRLESLFMRVVFISSLMLVIVSSGILGLNRVEHSRVRGSLETQTPSLDYKTPVATLWGPLFFSLSSLLPQLIINPFASPLAFPSSFIIS